MKFLAIVLFATFSFSMSTAIANEAHLQESSGSLFPVDSESTDIRLVSERVVIELCRESYTVDVTFEFMNEGDTVTVPVGFPDYGYGYIGTFRGVRTNDTFETWVNEEPAEFRIVPGKMTLGRSTLRDGNMYMTFTNPDSLDAAHERLRQGLPPFEHTGAHIVEETRWLVKEVTFSEGETTETRVRYTAEYGNFNQLEYLYGTGRTWKGTIGLAVFVVKATPDVWMDGVPRFHSIGGGRENAFPETRRIGEFEHEYILTDVEPRENDVFAVFAHWKDGDRNEGPYGTLWYVEKLVEDDFLDILSLAQLRHFRNDIYARHGKIFTSPDLDAWFRNTYWYQPRADFSESDLTEIDRENIGKIIEKEKWLRERIAEWEGE